MTREEGVMDTSPKTLTEIFERFKVDVHEAIDEILDDAIDAAHEVDALGWRFVKTEPERKG